MKRWAFVFVVTAQLLTADYLWAELTSLKILRREPFAGGKTFGDVGPYERIIGLAKYEIDPAHARNQGIVDLNLAPRNAAGKVEFEADVDLLAPVDPAKGNGAIFYDVNNRGGKLALRFFNHAKMTNTPTTAEDAGDGFLMRRGYVIVWSGWLGELLPGDGRLRMRAPVALQDGKPLRGLVRYEIMTDEPAEVMPLTRREGHGAFPLTERGQAEATLTWRQRENDPRVPIPRGQWSIESGDVKSVEFGVTGTLPHLRLRVADGFRPGFLYELIGECEGSIVQGVCYPAVRDLISFFKHETSEQNPFRTVDGKPLLTRAHGFGVSQSGRYLRNFLYLGFNADEADRKVFDGLMPHVGGAGLGYFNHRFAQPTKFASQHLEHLYPSDYFPFAYGDDVDPFTQQTDGLQRRLHGDEAKFLPKVMNTQGAGEYWSRAGSLVHTDPLGTRDAEVPENVRLYSFGGTQHSAATGPLDAGYGDNLLNPADYNPFLRVLLDALDSWAKDSKTPPPSVYPRIADGTLVDWRRESTGFPLIPGVRYPELIQTARRLDFGPDFWTKGISTIEPPRELEAYKVLAPRVGPDGNDLGTLLPIEVAVPTATYTGWNLRRADAGAEGEMVALMGSYIPFPKTKADRTATGDPRESLEERYGNYAEYERRFREACADYVKRGYLLQEDADRLISRLGSVKEMFAE